MTLSAEFVDHPDIARAAHEALANVERLRLAGYFAEAFEVCSALVRRGSWECSKAGQNFQAAAAALPTLAWLNSAICPALPREPRRTPAQLASWAKATQRDAFGYLLISDRLQLKSAGAGWTKELLESVANDSTGKPSRELAEFINDLDWVLNDRVRRALQTWPPELMPVGLTPVRTSAPIDVSNDAAPFGHDYLMDVLFRSVTGIGGAGYLGDRCLMFSVALDLAAGDRASAVARLIRWAEGLLGNRDYPLRHWEPYVAALRDHELASAMGVDDHTVDTYMAKFRRRPEGMVAVSSAEAVDWGQLISEFSQRQEIRFTDPSHAESQIAMLECHAPRSQVLIDRATRSEFVGPGLDESQMEALESRLGERLPPSYRSFLQTTNGLFGGGWLSVLPADDVDWFRNLDPDSVAAWNENDHEATDEQYATYGPDQDCIHMRPRHLRTALQVSTSIDGDVLLLVPAVRFGEEWEAWFLGSKNPGAFRYRSFAEMMDETIFKWGCE